MRLFPALKAVIMLSTGIVIGYWLRLDPRFYIALSALTLICSIFLEKYPVFGQIMLIIAIIAGGVGSINAYHQFENFTPATVKVSGKIVSTPYYFSNNANFSANEVTLTSSNGRRLKSNRLIWGRVNSRMENLTEGAQVTFSG